MLTIDLERKAHHEPRTYRNPVNPRHRCTAFWRQKAPDAARSLGRSMRIFKSEVKEMSNDDQRYEEQQQQRQIAAQAQQQVVNPVEIPQPQPTDIQRPQQ